MKKYLLLLFVFSIFVVDIQLILGASWDDFRNHEAILFTGQSIKQFITAPVDQIFIFSYREEDNSWRQITFQIDELDGDKGYFNKNYNAVVDTIDEFLFLAGDAGDYALPSSWIDDEDSKQYVRYQIELTNPDDPLTKKYVYIYRSSVLTHDPLLPFYVKYVAATSGASDTVIASAYLEGHNNKGIPDEWRIADSTGNYGIDILDRQKARVKGKYNPFPFVTISYNLNENDLKVDKLEYKSGPIRIIRDITYKTKISEINIDVGTFRYRYYPYRIVSLGADKKLESDYGVKLIRQSFDLDSTAIGMIFNNIDNFDILIDGMPDAIEDTIYQSPVMNWYMYSGDNGTVVVLNEVTPPSNATPKLYYHESLTDSTGDKTTDTGDKKSYGDAGISFTGSKIKGSISIPYFNYFLPGNRSREVGVTFAYQAQNRLTKYSSLQNYIPPAEIAISLPDTSGPSQYPISIPILVGDVTGLDIFSSQLAVQFDTLVLAATGVTVTNTLAENWDSIVINIVSDTIFITMEGATALQDSGVLVYLDFHVIGIEGKQSPLHFVQARFNNWNPLALATDGVFTALAVPEVLVRIPDSYGGASSEVFIPIKVDDEVTGLNISKCIIELQFSKYVLDADSIFVDGTIASKWTDVSFTDRIGYAKIAMSGDSYLAGTGTLVWINFKVIGKPGQTTDIIFKNMIFNEGIPLDTTRNGHFTVNSPQFIDVIASISDTTIKSGSPISIPVSLSSRGGFDLYSYKMDLTFGTGILEFQNVDTTATITSVWGYPLVRYSPGNLSITAEGLAPLARDGALIYLNFNVIGADSSSTVIHFSELTFNSGTYAADTRDGTIYVQGVVPVELSSFAATVTNNDVKLEWITVTESNNYGFYIQRTADKFAEWQTIGFVNGNGTTASPQAYVFIDHDVSSGSWYYRLKQQDLDGKINYSQVVEVNLLPTKFTLYQNYPNPFNSATTIKYELPAGEHQVTLIIYDLLGHQLRRLVNEENQQAGAYQFSWDGQNGDGKAVATGIYFYRLQVGNRTFIKKMVLIE